MLLLLLLLLLLRSCLKEIYGQFVGRWEEMSACRLQAVLRLLEPGSGFRASLDHGPSLRATFECVSALRQLGRLQLPAPAWAGVVQLVASRFDNVSGGYRETTARDASLLAS